MFQPSAAQTANGEILPPLPTEQILIDISNRFESCRGLVVSPGRGQLAWKLSAADRTASIQSWYMDLYDAHRARQVTQQVAPQVHISCSADLPDERFDLVALPVLVGGEAELTRDLLQQAHQRLDEGGLLATSVDNPRDQWLRLQMQELFDKVTCIDAGTGRAYLGRKTKSLKRIRNFGCHFTFQDEGRLIQAFSRPAVFSHRRLDPGARQLLLTVDVEAEQRVLDLGCGSGVLSLAARQRADGVQVVAVDSCARAIQCTQTSTLESQLDGITTIHNCDGQLELDQPVDIVLANPPYFGDFRIAEQFLDVADRFLRPGGAVLVVTKQPQWYEQCMPARFQDIDIFPSGNYFVACGRK